MTSDNGYIPSDPKSLYRDTLRYKLQRYCSQDHSGKRPMKLILVYGSMQQHTYEINLVKSAQILSRNSGEGLWLTRS